MLEKFLKENLVLDTLGTKEQLCAEYCFGIPKNETMEELIQRILSYFSFFGYAHAPTPMIKNSFGIKEKGESVAGMLVTDAPDFFMVSVIRLHETE